MDLPLPLSARALFAALFDGNAPVVVDLRLAEDAALDPGWIPASHRLAYDDLAGHLAVTSPGTEVVLICQGGLKLSQGAAARLILKGRRARYLEGRLLAWRAACLPLMGAGPGVWVSSASPAADPPAALAARWAALRLLPRPSEVISVAAEQADAVAARFGGEVLPPMAGVLDWFDRPVPELQSAAEFAASAGFERLARGAAEAGALAVLDAWMRGAEVAA